MLLTYSRYVDLGGTLRMPEFTLYEMLAEADLKSVASGELPDTKIVETCMMMMISAYSTADSIASKGVATGYSNDGVSVSYSQSATSEDIISMAQDRLKSIFASYGINFKSLAVMHRA